MQEESLSQEQIETVNDRLFFEMPRVRTSVGVVFGAGGMSRTIAEEAIKLKAAGAFNKIILSGGGNVFNPMLLIGFALKGKWGLFRTHIWDTMKSRNNEATLMYKIMNDAGVDSREFSLTDILSKNTGENIENTKRTIMRFESATFIASAPMQRRAIGTARMHNELDHVAITTHPVDSFGVTATNWHQQEETFLGRFIRRYVTREYAKMDPHSRDSYMMKGFCKDPDLDAERERLKDLPKYTL